MSKIASLGLAEKVSEGGKYSIEIYDADEESRIYSICLPSLFVSLDGLGMKGILQSPDDAVLIDKFWFNGQEIGAVWQDDDEIKAIAKEKKVKEPLAGSFISKYGLTATSSVKSALSRMLDEEIIYRAPDGLMPGFDHLALVEMQRQIKG